MKTKIALIVLLGLSVAVKAQNDYLTGQTKLTNPTGRTLLLERNDSDSWLTFHDNGNAWYSMGIDQSNGHAFSLNYGGNLTSSHFVMTRDGKIGIGTSSPRGRLDIGRSLGANNGLRIGDYIELNERETINNAGVISFNASVSSTDVSKFVPSWTGSSAASGMVVSMKTGGVSDLTFYGYKWGNDATPRSIDEFTKILHLSTNGNIGIGTSSSDDKLTIMNGINGMSFQAQKDWIGLGFNRSVQTGKIYNNAKTGWQLTARDERFSLEGYNGGPNNPLNILKNGNIGVGTITPFQKLDIVGVTYLRNAPTHSRVSEQVRFGRGDSDIRYHSIYSNHTGSAKTNYLDFRVHSGNSSDVREQISVMTLNGEGNVGIGTINPKGFKLGVNGKIAATEVKVATYANWADFVFKKDYNLPTLAEVENHIKTNGHLVDIPSAEEVKQNGFYLGAMDARLLQKIEELTLYTIQQEKEIKRLKKQESRIKKQEVRINNQEARIKNQQKEINELKALVNKLIKK
ncbi:hypothetical protein [Tenacibaculum jejuense]|uniref:Peptidase S74 domain-containing protein n=1 Tax=Tenacibaculum jejuense TaxID=584609 RepID=A0A238UCA8_9FLAO|nr:hypothetical protein [Tenacibaculum jejuense]SNR16050.1 Protein of unknown function precursor [Tenacibaculum jejuense]